jgi:hypothetical protein
MIPAFITNTVAVSYSVGHQRALLMAWTKRFAAFTAGLPAVMQGAQATPGQNVFTAGEVVALYCTVPPANRGGCLETDYSSSIFVCYPVKL